MLIEGEEKTEITEKDEESKNKNKIPKKSNAIKKRKHLDSDNIVIPALKDYKTFRNNNYKLQELKEICKHYHQKTSGTKEKLNESIYTFLYHSYHVLILQRTWKKYCIKKYNQLHGPGRKNRKICVNETEFYSIEPLSTISYEQFFSFKDKDEMIYGFDVLSLHNLIQMGGKETKNPYNRNPITADTKNNIKKLITYSKFIGHPLTIEISETTEKLTLDQMAKTKIKSLFQEMDRLGNYTNADWLIQLERYELVKFVRELYDIWCFRAHLMESTKMEICPPHGNPFVSVNVNLFGMSHLNNDELLMLIANLIECFIKNGINNESKCLGANYVLCALTLVNNQAADAMPWLYYSVSSHN